MFAIYRKGISSGSIKLMSGMEASSYTEALREFTEQVREWLSNDETGKVFYDLLPNPGWYDESENPILMDGDTIERYNDGHNEYYFGEL